MHTLIEDLKPVTRDLDLWLFREGDGIHCLDWGFVVQTIQQMPTPDFGKVSWQNLSAS